MSAPIDMPQWSPSPRTNRQAVVSAWRQMYAALQTHEHEHRRIGREWKTELQNRARAVNLTVTASSQDEARTMLVEQLMAQKEQWVSDAQAAQDEFDANTNHGATAYGSFPAVVFTCPPVEESE
jgi:predicted secreted Zn-dependent protease